MYCSIRRPYAASWQGEGKKEKLCGWLTDYVTGEWCPDSLLGTHSTLACVLINIASQFQGTSIGDYFPPTPFIAFCVCEGILECLTLPPLSLSRHIWAPASALSVQACLLISYNTCIFKWLMTQTNLLLANRNVMQSKAGRGHKNWEASVIKQCLNMK